MARPATPPPPKAASSSCRSRVPHTEDIQVHPAELGALFTRCSLVWGESKQDYDTLLTRVTAAIKPQDALEELLVKDITDLAWEAQRLRRIRAGLMQASARAALQMTLDELPDPGIIDGQTYHVGRLVDRYVRGDERAVELVDRTLAEFGLDAEGIIAVGLTNHSSSLDLIERLLAGAEARRSRALNELYRHREAAARLPRLRGTDVTDVS